MKKISAIIVLLLSLVQFSFGQIELATDKVKWKFSIEKSTNNEAFIVAKVSVVEHWHINAINVPKGSFIFPTNFRFKPSKHYQLIGTVKEPKPIFKHDDLADEDLYYHEGTVTFKQKIKFLSDESFNIEGEFNFQTCNDVKCLPDYTAKISIPAKGEVITDSPEQKDSIIQETTTSPTDTVIESKKLTTKNTKATQPSNKKTTENSSLIGLFILSFLSGLAALLTPCVFPMIPMTVSFFTKQSKSKAEGIRNAIIYGLSIIIIYILLGTVVTAIFGAQALNEMSTNPIFNLVFFTILVVFAISFLGAFEIRMPSKWVNNVDAKADRGGLIGIFFMALALALVSFSCTGPIVGTLLVEAASKGGIAPFVGMFGFSLALALPFGLFAAFPGWMNTLPKSGGWLNTVKVVLGFLELALAFKFLSNADLAVQAHYLERELFIAIWIGIFLALALYLFGAFRLPHDSPLEKLSVGRALFGTFVLIIVLYLLPGMWGAPLKLVSAFPPPLHYSESPTGLGTSNQTSSNDVVEGTHLGPQNIQVFEDYDLALAYAKKVGKPLFVDFTGHNCVNCRKMEQSVWGEPGIIDILKNDVVIVSLHVDERTELPKNEQKIVEFTPGNKQKLLTVGDKWMYKQIKEYQVTAQPYYVMVNQNGKNLENGSADFEHHQNPQDFLIWLQKGLKSFEK